MVFTSFWSAGFKGNRCIIEIIIKCIWNHMWISDDLIIPNKWIRITIFFKKVTNNFSDFLVFFLRALNQILNVIFRAIVVILVHAFLVCLQFNIMRSWIPFESMVQCVVFLERSGPGAIHQFLDCFRQSFFLIEGNTPRINQLVHNKTVQRTPVYFL